MALRTFADGSLFGARFGTGTPRVLALHGWGRTHKDFEPVLSGLDALSIDLPGFGASPAPTDPGGASMYAKLIEPVLDECHLPLVVVGHSFGGRVAVHLNERRPSAIAGLVLTGVPLLHKAHGHGKVAYQYRVGKWLNRLRLVNDDFVENLKNKYGSADYRAAEGVMRDILVTCVNESYDEQLKKIGCPVDLIWGDGDTAVPPEIAARAEALINDVRLTILGNVDHFVPTIAPLALKETIQLQLAALDD